ncbi:MAG: hypothetical protein D6731_21835 [Planctomycetota bacterium]|nr:MAG: hypothetical protein D6731_21835 [Planctomycetota bacterium]
MHDAQRPADPRRLEANRACLALPFAHLNLRYNPFGELPLELRPSLAVLDPEPFLARLAPLRAALQFLGEKGRGKTTHLLALRSARPGVYVHLPEDGPLPAVPLDAPLLYLDESQRLPWRLRRALFAGPSRLVLGTHRDHRRALRWAGRPVVTVKVGDALDETRLREILERRIEAARRGPGPVPRLTKRAIERLLARFGDDLRGIEHFLYERFQALDAPGDVDA